MQTAVNSPSIKPRTKVGRFNRSKNLAKNTKPTQNRIPKMQTLPYQMFANNSSTKNQNRNLSSNLNDNQEQEEYIDDNDDDSSSAPSKAEGGANNKPQTVQGQINKSRNLSQQQQEQGEEENNEENADENEENEDEESEEDKYIDKQNKEIDEYNEQNPDRPQMPKFIKPPKQNKKDNTIKEDSKKQAFFRECLQQAWLNTIDTFGITLIYVWFHFIMRYVASATTYFCKFGVLDPISNEITKTVDYKKTRSTSNKINDKIHQSIGAEYFEIIGAVLSFVLVLFIILGAMTIFALVVGVLANPWKTIWHVLKNMVKAFLPSE